MANFFDLLKQAMGSEYSSNVQHLSNLSDGQRQRFRDERGVDPLAQYNDHVDRSIGDISDMNDIDFAKDFDWTDEDGNTHRWRIGYKNDIDENGNPITSYGGKIVSVFDRDNPVDPVYGRENLRKLFKDYFGTDQGVYTINDLGTGYGDRGTTGVQYLNRTYDVGAPKWYGTFNGKKEYMNDQFNPWEAFPTGYL